MFSEESGSFNYYEDYYLENKLGRKPTELEIKLNKLLMVNRGVFNKMAGKKIVLNKSLLTSKDVLDFEYEANTKVFYNMPPLDERKNNENYINPFLSKLGFVKQVKEVNENKGKIFGLFKF